MASESIDQVYDFVVNKGNGIRALVETGLKSVPDRYVQPLEEQFDKSKLILDESMIPTIDVSSWDNDPKTVEMVCNAARKHGFFQIINHGIPEEVLDQAMEAGRKFFELPIEEKLVYKTNSTNKGCTTVGTSFVPNNEKVLEWKDYLYHLYDPSNEDTTNNWPPICKDQLLEYFKRIEEMVKKMYNVLLKGLNMEGYDDTKRSLFMGYVGLLFNCYPHCPNPDLTVGVGRHSDITCFTILLQDDVGGLHVRAQDGESWIFVKPRKGALVVNIGDSMEIMSNGRYKSIEHKVVPNATRTRFSLATFIFPENTQVIAPLPEVLEVGETKLYKEVLFGDYRKHFFGKGHDGKATIDFVKI